MTNTFDLGKSQPSKAATARSSAIRGKSFLFAESLPKPPTVNLVSSKLTLRSLIFAVSSKFPVTKPKTTSGCFKMQINGLPTGIGSFLPPSLIALKAVVLLATLPVVLCIDQDFL